MSALPFLPSVYTGVPCWSRDGQCHTARRLQASMRPQMIRRSRLWGAFPCHPGLRLPASSWSSSLGQPPRWDLNLQLSLWKPHRPEKQSVVVSRSQHHSVRTRPVGFCWVFALSCGLPTVTRGRARLAITQWGRDEEGEPRVKIHFFSCCHISLLVIVSVHPRAFVSDPFCEWRHFCFEVIIFPARAAKRSTF